MRWVKTRVPRLLVLVMPFGVIPVWHFLIGMVLVYFGEISAMVGLSDALGSGVVSAVVLVGFFFVAPVWWAAIRLSLWGSRTAATHQVKASLEAAPPGEGRTCALHALGRLDQLQSGAIWFWQWHFLSALACDNGPLISEYKGIAHPAA